MPHNRSMGEVLEAALGDRLSQLSAVIPGEVVSWDSDNETVAVQPLVRGHDGTARPEVPQCPVIFPGAYWDIQPGDVGILLVCDQDIETWWRTGQQSAPATRQSHQIGNSVFIPGLRDSGSTRTHSTGTLTLEKPTPAGEVHLGDAGANKAVVHEDLLSALNIFLVALDAWGTAVGTFCSVPWDVAGPGVPLETMTDGIAANSYESSSVKVEN